MRPLPQQPPLRVAEGGGRALKTGAHVPMWPHGHPHACPCVRALWHRSSDILSCLKATMATCGGDGSVFFRRPREKPCQGLQVKVARRELSRDSCGSQASGDCGARPRIGGRAGSSAVAGVRSSADDGRTAMRQLRAAFAAATPNPNAKEVWRSGHRFAVKTRGGRAPAFLRSLAHRGNEFKSTA